MLNALNSRQIRQFNCAKVFRVVQSHGAISRADLARFTRLSPATVTETVRILLKAGYLTEAELGEASGGRPPIMIRINNQRNYIIGIDLDVRKMTVLLCNLGLETISAKTVVLDTINYQEVLATIAAQVECLIREHAVNRRKILGLGLGVPGYVNFTQGLVRFAPNLRWQDEPIKEDLESMLKLEVLVENDAKLSAFGEKWFGAGQEANEMAYVSVKAGLGCGLIFDGEIYRGIDGSAGELGHMTIDPAGPECTCGNYGCWETFADNSAILSRALRATAATPDSMLRSISEEKGRQITIDDLTEAFHMQDPVAVKVVRESAWYLGIGIVNIVNAFNPELVIIGGEIIKAGPQFFEAVKAVVQKRALRVPRERAKIVPSVLGEKACAIGATMLVIENWLSQPNAFRIGKQAVSEWI